MLTHLKYFEITKKKTLLVSKTALPDSSNQKLLLRGDCAFGGSACPSSGTSALNSPNVAPKFAQNLNELA
jgi:hypothetical protein